MMGEDQNRGEGCVVRPAAPDDISAITSARLNLFRTIGYSGEVLDSRFEEICRLYLERPFLARTIRA